MIARIKQLIENTIFEIYKLCQSLCQIEDIQDPYKLLKILHGKLG